jgi:purine-binding chemotaxis protein CheW
MRDTTEARQRMEQILSFTAAGADFGVSILKVREILQYESVTEVPGAPASVRGVANVRGAVVPVLDLGARLGRGAAAPTKRSCILVVDVAPAGEPLTLGVFADAVNEVVDLQPGDVEPPPVLGGGVKLSYIVGLGRLGKRFILLVDLDRVLSASEAKHAAAVATSAARRAELFA